MAANRLDDTVEQGQEMHIPSPVGDNVRARILGGGDLRRPLSEHHRAIYLDKAYYGHVSDGGAESGMMFLKR